MTEKPIKLTSLSLGYESNTWVLLLPSAITGIEPLSMPDGGGAVIWMAGASQGIEVMESPDKVCELLGWDKP